MKTKFINFRLTKSIFSISRKVWNVYYILKVLGVRTPLKETFAFTKKTVTVELYTNSESISLQGD